MNLSIQRTPKALLAVVLPTEKHIKMRIRQYLQAKDLIVFEKNA